MDKNTGVQVLKHLAARLIREGMRMLIVLTKVDLVDTTIDEDVASVAYSHVVNVMRNAISAETGVPLNQVCIPHRRILHSTTRHTSSEHI